MCQVRACRRDAHIAQSANRRRRAEKAHVTARSAIARRAHVRESCRSPGASSRRGACRTNRRRSRLHRPRPLPRSLRSLPGAPPCPRCGSVSRSSAMSAGPRIDKEDRNESAAPVAATVTLRPQRKGVLHRLRRVDKIVQTTVFAKAVAHAFMALYISSPTGAPVHIGKRGEPLGPERLELLGFHAYERGGGRDQAIQNGMSPAHGNRTVASRANDRTGHPASGQPDNCGITFACPRKYPKVLTASAADDSGLSNFPLSISLSGAFLYMRSISCPGTPGRNRRVFMTETMAASTPRRRREPFGLHSSTRPASISGKRPSRNGTRSNVLGKARTSSDIDNASPIFDFANRSSSLLVSATNLRPSKPR